MYKSRIQALVLPGLIALTPALVAAPRAERPRLMITEFPVTPGAYEGWTGWGYNGGQAQINGALQDLMITAIVEKAGDLVRLMERKRLEDILAEQKLGQSGLVDDATAVEMGKLIGCQYMITGKITRFAYKKSGFSTGWGVTALLRKVSPGLGAGAAVAGDVHVAKASFTGRLDCRLIDIKTGEILVVAKEEGSVSDVGVKVAGTGSDVQYDQELVGKIFEPIVEKIALKLVARLQALKDNGELAEATPEPVHRAPRVQSAPPPPMPPPQAPAPVVGMPVQGMGVPVLPFMMPSGTGVETVEPGRLKALLPGSVAGLGRSNQEAQKVAMGIFRVAKASARYGGSATLTITDLGGVNTFGMLAPWATMEQDRETDTGYDKMGKVNGRQVHERYDTSGRNGLYSVIIANRFMVEATGNRIDIETLRQLVNAVAFDQLEAMRTFGTNQ